jgi:hypothetical protein
LVARTPFDAIQAKKTIGRLTQDLASARKEMRQTQDTKEKIVKAPIGTELIDNTLQILT